MPPTKSPSPDNLLLGKGIVYFNRFDDAGNPTGFRDLGNVETFEISTTDDKLQKFSSRTSKVSLYKEVTRSRTVTLRMSGDEFDPENIALAMMGDNAQTAAQAATAVANEQLAANGNGKASGIAYKLARQGPLTAFTNLKQGSTVLVRGVDYDVNMVHGIVRLLPTSPTIIPVGTITADYTPPAYTAGLTRVRGGVVNTIRGAIMFAGDPASGPKMQVNVWKVALSPEGALGLLSDDFATFGLTMTVEEDAVGHPDSPLFDIVYLA